MRRNPFQIKASFQSYESDVFFASGVLRLRHFPKVAEWNGAPRDGGKGFATRHGGASGEPRRATIESYRNGTRVWSAARGAGCKAAHRAGGEPPRAGSGRILRV